MAYMLILIAVVSWCILTIVVAVLPLLVFVCNVCECVFDPAFVVCGVVLIIMLLVLLPALHKNMPRLHVNWTHV